MGFSYEVSLTSIHYFQELIRQRNKEVATAAAEKSFLIELTKHIFIANRSHIIIILTCE